MATNTKLPTIRWGIVATGQISAWFVPDLLLPSWPDKQANHIIQAIGGSSLKKAQAFCDKIIQPRLEANANVKPDLYGDYHGVYNDPNVDVVYIGTPHSFHAKNCLDAIAAGKNILCEKAFTLTEKETKEVFKAAKEKGVFVMEAIWTRYYPLVKTLQKMLNEEKVIGDVWRTFADFSIPIDISKLPDTNRYKSLDLGAGTLLDLGIYSLTWGIVTLSKDGKVGDEAEDPEIAALQTLQDGVDVVSSWILKYPSTGRQAILTSTTNGRTRNPFARIEGSKGYITVNGSTPSPKSFTVYQYEEDEKNEKGKTYEFEKPGMGFYWEADAVAMAITKGGILEDPTMPWKETERVMRIMDAIRKQGGAKFPVDDE